jgi:hypothetical protein
MKPPWDIKLLSILLLLVSISEASLSHQASLYFLLLVSISEASLSNQTSLYFVVVSIH